jgi:hypothetical protein
MDPDQLDHFDVFLTWLLDPRHLMVFATAGVKYCLHQWEMFPERWENVAMTLLPLILCFWMHQPPWMAILWGWAYATLGWQLWKMLFGREAAR